MTKREELNAALQDLCRRHTFGIKLGLHVETALLEHLGNPQRAWAAVHVAGTNGKGSVCALLESMLRAAGFRTGLYTSPHLVRLNERIRTNGAELSDDNLLALIREVEAHSQAVARELGQEPTFFEFTTALAFEQFRREKVQIAVVEVGMGGRLDATNVVEPAVSVITGIGLEHTAYLGPDIPAIAAEKAGIVKAGRPVVCARLDEAAMRVLRETAARLGAPMVIASERVSVSVVSETLRGQKVRVESSDMSYGTFTLPLVGRHQLDNLTTAVAALECICDALGMQSDPRAVKKGVEATEWPGRFQVLQEEPVMILDGAHNPQAAEALADAIDRLLPKRPVGLVLGMCGDKDARGFLRPLARVAKRLWLVPIASERNMPAAALRAAAEGVGLGVEERSLQAALEEAKQWAKGNGGAVCVTGSLFLVGEVLDKTHKR